MTSTIEELCSNYNTEYEYLCSKYKQSSEEERIDFLKQIVAYYETANKVKGNKRVFSKIPIGWNASIFKNYILEEKEYDEYMENPLGNEMHDSVVPCIKCGSSKTFNIEKQTRSLDEPSTVITICYTCKHRHKYSG